MAAAQDIPAATVSVGYAALKDKDVDGVFFRGWAASVGGALTRALEIVGEVGGNYKTLGSPPGFDAEASVKIHTFMGGPRYVWRGKGGDRGFVQMLAGAARGSAAITACGSIPEEFCGLIRNASVSRTFFSLQPGGGVDFGIARRTAIRLQADYRAIFPREEGEGTVVHEFRFGAGVVMGFGRR
jgi:hypothetical protein